MELERTALINQMKYFLKTLGMLQQRAPDAAVAGPGAAGPSRGTGHSKAQRLLKALDAASGPGARDYDALCAATRTLWELCGEQAGLCLRSDVVPRTLVAVSQLPVLTMRQVQAFWHVAAAVRRLAISEASGAAIARWSARWADSTTGSAIICACSRALRGASDLPTESDVHEHVQRPVAGLLSVLLFHARGRCRLCAPYVCDTVCVWHTVCTCE